MEWNESHFLHFCCCWKIVCYVSQDSDQSICYSIERVSEWVSVLDWVSEELNWLIDWVSKWSSTSMILKPDKKMDHAVWAKNLNSTRKHKLNFPQVFFYCFLCPATRKWRGIMLYPPKFWVSVRPSVCLSVRPSVRPCQRPPPFLYWQLLLQF